MATIVFLANNEHVYLPRPYLLRSKILLSVVFIVACFMHISSSVVYTYS